VFDDPSPMDLGIGPLGRIYVWDVCPQAAVTNNIAASQTTTTAGQAVTLTAGTSESLIGPKLKSDLPAFFEATDYVGAFKSTDWTSGWSEFSPQSVVYVK
jgi:hypothetical protein